MVLLLVEILKMCCFYWEILLKFEKLEPNNHSLEKIIWKFRSMPYQATTDTRKLFLTDLVIGSESYLSILSLRIVRYAATVSEFCSVWSEKTDFQSIDVENSDLYIRLDQNANEMFATNYKN